MFKAGTQTRYLTVNANTVTKRMEIHRSIE